MYIFYILVILPLKDQDIVATVEKLDWLKSNERTKQRGENIGVNDITSQKHQEYNVILGSDIVYERSLILPLCKVLKGYLFVEGQGYPEKVAYIACTERSRTTLECFEVQCDHIDYLVFYKFNLFSYVSKNKNFV